MLSRQCRTNNRPTPNWADAQDFMRLEQLTEFPSDGRSRRTRQPTNALPEVIHDRIQCRAAAIAHGYRIFWIVQVHVAKHVFSEERLCSRVVGPEVPHHANWRVHELKIAALI